LHKKTQGTSEITEIKNYHIVNFPISIKISNTDGRSDEKTIMAFLGVNTITIRLKISPGVIICNKNNIFTRHIKSATKITLQIFISINTSNLQIIGQFILFATLCLFLKFINLI
jgi:hypothetical protein